MTETDADLETRLARVLDVGADALPVGRVVPPFDPTRRRRRPGRQRRHVSRRVAVASATLGLVLTGSAAAAVVEHLASAPVTATDEARCYSTDRLAGGDGFAGLTITASGPPGSRTQVTDALADCSASWRDGFLTLGSTEAGGTRPPSGPLDPDHPVPPLVVCVLPDGVAAVFPGTRHTCENLGLPAAQSNS